MSDHHTERISVFVPPYIKVEIGLDSETRALVNRALSLKEGKIQGQIDALSKRLKASRDKLADVVVSNPDPNPND